MSNSSEKWVEVLVDSCRYLTKGNYYYVEKEERKGELLFVINDKGNETALIYGDYECAHLGYNGIAVHERLPAIEKNSTKEKMEVMQAWLEGKEIEMAKHGVVWEPVPDNPSWNWGACSYRVKPEKPSINWEHVADEYNFLAVDKMGAAYLYGKCPVIDDYDIGVWATTSGEFSTAVTHKSLFLPEGLDWENSLVERPNITKGN